MAVKDNSYKRGNTHRQHMYDARPPVLAKRKDRNVKRSSHGKFNDVASLKAHQQEVSRPVRHWPAWKPVPENNWLTHDKGRVYEDGQRYIRRQREWEEDQERQRQEALAELAA